MKIDGEGGAIEHSKITFGDAVVMVVSERLGIEAKFATAMLSRLTAAGKTQSLMLYVDDVDAHCERARTHGAKVIDEPQMHDYGEDYWADRSYGAIDPKGHLWWFTRCLRGRGKLAATGCSAGTT